ncbi:Putative outer membrane protein [Bradyrhizobium sp. ORS 278]|uniref:outer membrane protein n=1 Tax=Bradyrhizobium sp. (strain ORS 278) TaxID=114615 RepID=UPI0001508EE4|nr:outer membrane beta-barrel protein [Bradyrhizobium sp. ORS 278]CAL79923.1 Putative outer membrane protein [Bradyrhizobium sp. ORS 278]
MSKRLVCLGGVVAVLIPGGSVFAADLPVKAPTFAERFAWSGCHLGLHLGGAWASNSITDPVLLVQDNGNLGGPGFTTVGTTVKTGQSGGIAGGQIGCDYQFPSSVVVGAEFSASGAALNGSRTFALPDSPPDIAQAKIKTDFITDLTARAGYAVDHWLFYAKGGVAWASTKYSVTGGFTNAGANPAIAFDFEGLSVRTGWTAGAGVEWAFAQDWSARFEYDYYDFGTRAVNMVDVLNGNAAAGPLSFKTSVQTVKVGVNFHVGGAGL